jgi:hypothetical protein
MKSIEVYFKPQLFCGFLVLAIRIRNSLIVAINKSEMVLLIARDCEREIFFTT